MALDKILEKLPKFKLFGVDLKDTVASAFSGFSNGYNAAVDAYFHMFSGSKKNFQVEKQKEENEENKENESDEPILSEYEE